MARTQPNILPQSELRVRLSEDRMLAELIVPARFPQELLTRGACAAAFNEKGVLVKDPQIEAIERQLETVRADPDRKHVLTLEGLSARHGLDGYLEFERRFVPKTSRPDDPDEPIDYYAQSRFINVNPGDVIARIVPPTKGTDGVDVTGQPRKARPGLPSPTRVHPTITVDGLGHCVANVAGVLNYEDHLLKVLQLLEIHGDVSFKTGNLKVQASVEVFGSVIDRFAVDTPFDLTVRHLTEGATIRTGGVFHAMGGMAGKLKGHLTIGRDLRARYLDNVVGVVKGNADVEREIVNSALDIDGELRMPNGSLVGSAIYVTRKVALRELGSDGGERTVLALGAAPKTEAMIARTEEALDEMTDQVEPIKAELQMLIYAGAGRIESERARVAELKAIEAALLERCRRIREKLDHLREQLESVRVVFLRVDRMIHPGVHLVIGGQAYRFDSAVRGPFCVMLDESGEPIVKDERGGSTLELARITRRFEAPIRGAEPRCLQDEPDAA